MKKLLPSIVLLVGLQGAPVPSQAGNGMGDIISTMMQMFLWMMGGGSGMSGFSPYAMNPMNPLSSMGSYGMSPYGLSGLNGSSNPYAIGAFPGYYGSQATPYGVYGYGGHSPYNLNNDYYRNLPGSAYRYNRYGQLDPNATRYDTYRPDYTPVEKPVTAPVVIQPIIVSPAKTEDGTATTKVEVLPPQTVTEGTTGSRVAAVPAPSFDQLSSSSGKSTDQTAASKLEGRWQGINGELLELGATSFRLQSRNADLQGRYELKNGIMKITVLNREKPVYMQYQVENQHLAFRTEDGRKMLFRRY